LVRDRRAGPRIPLPVAVNKLTQATATMYGLGDRGVVAPGFVGDLNLIDLEGLRLHRPQIVHDLPGDAKRFLQRADGYVATVKRGEVTFEEGEDTGARPGRLLRGAR
jgi:N-acyl-D-aspartate/D-glutamate deacylase